MSSMAKNRVARAAAANATANADADMDDIYNTIAEHSPVGISVTRPDGAILFINDKFTEMFGYSLKNVKNVDDWFGKAFSDGRQRREARRVWKEQAQANRDSATPSKPRDWDVTCADGAQKQVQIIISANAESILTFFIDTSQRREAERILREYESVLENYDSMVTVVDRNHRYLLVNEAFLERQNLKREHVVGEHSRDILGEEAYEKILPWLNRCFNGEKIDYEMEQIFQDRDTRYLHVGYYPMHAQDGSVDRVVAITRDVTNLREAQADRQRVFELSLDLLSVTGKNGLLREINTAWERTLGWSKKELTTKPWIEFVHPDDRDATNNSLTQLQQGNPVIGFENRYMCKDGTAKWLSWNSYPDMQRQEILGVARDITDRKRYEENLRELATTDSLTSLYNRRHFMERALEELTRSKRYNENLSFLVIDIDHFKEVNDSYGHDVGDKVLKQVSELCSRSLRANDFIGRLGGEEFVIALLYTDQVTALLAAERIRQTIAKSKFNISGAKIQLTISIGTASLANADDTIDTILKSADRALYRAKDLGRNRTEAG